MSTENRIFNFSAGPAVLPEAALLKAQKELLNFNGSGMSIMEMSHRSRYFAEVIEGAEARLRQLLDISDQYAVLFLQGGASLQFSMLPMNLVVENRPVDVLLTGSWTKKAVKELQKVGQANILRSSEDKNFSYIQIGRAHV